MSVKDYVPIKRPCRTPHHVGPSVVQDVLSFPPKLLIDICWAKATADRINNYILITLRKTTITTPIQTINLIHTPATQT